MNGIVAIIIFLIIVIFNIVTAIKEAGKNQPPPGQKGGAGVRPPERGEIIIRSKPSKPKRKRETEDFDLAFSEESRPDNLRRPAHGETALVRQLPPQGEGKRFEAAPGTLDTSAIVAATIDPAINPKLESMTGIYEKKHETQHDPAVLTAILKPENIHHAVIMAEIFGKAKWEESP